MIRYLWLAVVVWLFAKLLGFIFRRASQSAQQAQQPGMQTPDAHRPQPLHRDPVCGTYVAGEISKTLELSGHVLHFCSEECRKRYLASGQRPPSAREGRMSASA